ncbi:MAG: hypothetical protein IJ177_09740 [Fibrobacter sp.]|uniref:hypothetical protein n=1 Tax=Fibrobacter sp. TaxID=35828 RepID=UPI0025BFBE2A|nr:hypothetical protein [Fibrobacter sp.]MBQ9226453.1 hypothetical protein [Fibrobacter sp.]
MLKSVSGGISTFSDWAITACPIWQSLLAKSVSDGGKTSNFAPKSAVKGLFDPNSAAVNSRTGRVAPAKGGRRQAESLTARPEFIAVSGIDCYY